MIKYKQNEIFIRSIGCFFFLFFFFFGRLSVSLSISLFSVLFLWCCYAFREELLILNCVFGMICHNPGDKKLHGIRSGFDWKQNVDIDKVELTIFNGTYHLHGQQPFINGKSSCAPISWSIERNGGRAISNWQNHKKNRTSITII